MTSSNDPTSTPEKRLTPGLPAWITPQLVEETLAVWQPYYRRRLTAEQAVEILMNVSELLPTGRDQR